MITETNEEVLSSFSRLNNELANAHRELAKRNAELQLADQQKNLFIGMVAHDLRNPLGAILGYSQLLQDSASDRLTEDERFALSLILHSSEFMFSVVNDLLDISKIESGTLTLHRTTVDLARLVQRSLDLNRPLASGKKITLTLSAAERLPTLALDANKCLQVFDNLIGNAIKYSPEGREVVVEGRANERWASVSVRDQGSGIPAEEIEAITEPFRTAHLGSIDGGKSTGLGLAIVKRIVEGHGGRLDIQSTVGGGSTFTVRFPVTTGPAA